MVQYLNEPQFPVIDEVPDTKTIMKGFRATDWRNMFLATVVSMPFGYSAGKYQTIQHVNALSLSLFSFFSRQNSDTTSNGLSI